MQSVHYVRNGSGARDWECGEGANSYDLALSSAVYKYAEHINSMRKELGLYEYDIDDMINNINDFILTLPDFLPQEED